MMIIPEFCGMFSFRIFKNFDTTPGKFLKKIKLRIAKELLDRGKPIHEVTQKTGYSAHYIKQHL